MSRWLRKSWDVAQLARPGLALSAVSNGWMVVFLARSGLDQGVSGGLVVEGGLPLVLALTALVSGGLHAYGIALNDVLDARHDRLFVPERPIAAGRVSQRTGVIVALVGLLAALAAAAVLGTGSVSLTLAVAGGILFYNTVGKHFAVTGIVTLSLVRAGHMFVPCPTLGFVFPIGLVMTHTLLATAMAHAQSGKRPRLHPREVWRLAAAWVFWTLALVGWMSSRGTLALKQDSGQWWIVFGLATVFAVLGWRATSMPTPLRHRRTAGARTLNAAMRGLMLYDAAWLMGLGFFAPAAAHLTLFLTGWAMDHTLRWGNGSTAPLRISAGRRAESVL